MFERDQHSEEGCYHTWEMKKKKYKYIYIHILPTFAKSSANIPSNSPASICSTKTHTHTHYPHTQSESKQAREETARPGKARRDLRNPPQGYRSCLLTVSFKTQKILKDKLHTMAFPRKQEIAQEETRKKQTNKKQEQEKEDHITREERPGWWCSSWRAASVIQIFSIAIVGYFVVLKTWACKERTDDLRRQRRRHTTQTFLPLPHLTAPHRTTQHMTVATISPARRCGPCAATDLFRNGRM